MTEEEPASEETNVLSEPVGLFSPRTGFGWESYMAPRLDKELIRAIGDKDSPIVAFRVNPEKYRNYLANNAQ